MPDADTVTTVEQLREILGAPHPLVTRKITTTLDDVGRRFIALAPFALLATADQEQHPDVSPRGDEPGFALIADDTTLYLPERKGNKLAFSLQNILVNPHVALIFVIPGVTETYRIHGSARIVRDPAILQRLPARGQPAVLAVEIRIRRCFLHCGKAIIRSQLWASEAQQHKTAFRFGATTARQAGGDEHMAQMIDKLVAEDYRDNL